MAPILANKKFVLFSITVPLLQIVTVSTIQMITYNERTANIKQFLLIMSPTFDPYVGTSVHLSSFLFIGLSVDPSVGSKFDSYEASVLVISMTNLYCDYLFLHEDIDNSLNPLIKGIHNFPNYCFNGEMMKF